MLKVIEKTKIWFAISLTIIFIGIIFGVVRGGLNYGIDFKGGTIVQIEFGKSKIDKTAVENIAKKYASDATTNIANNTQVEIRSEALKQADINKMFNEIKNKYNLKDKALLSQKQIGPSVGNDLKKNAVTSLAIAIVAILVYVAIRFEFKFGLSAIIALIHDVLITLSVYAIFNIQVNSPFIAAMLTITGYSVCDTVVVFDRIRENLRKVRNKDLAYIADKSITQTIARSIYTVLTVIITILCVYIFVPSVREFALPLLVGISSGCYSSIFIASPLWVIFKGMKKSKKTEKAFAK